MSMMSSCHSTYSNLRAILHVYCFLPIYHMYLFAGDKKKTQCMIDLKNVSDEWFEFQKVIGSLQDSKLM